MMAGEAVHRICLYLPCTGKEYAKGKRSGKCKESFCFWQPRGEREKWCRCLFGLWKRGDDS